MTNAAPVVTSVYLRPFVQQIYEPLSLWVWDQITRQRPWQQVYDELQGSWYPDRITLRVGLHRDG